MKVIKKTITFFKLDRELKWMLVEAYFLLGWARFLKTLPFAKVAPSLGKKMDETPYSINLDNKEVLQKVSTAIHLMSRYTPWESQCLVKAIAGMRMLERRQIGSTLYLGTGKDDKGELVAHAWLRSGPIYISGSEGMEKFTVVAKFAKNRTS
ncbi:lasso peptide biosynthesis B2 protein [Halalkalibacter akibai]|uniref:Microcin J25-processing protein McjB C-terminal domain-containing protein n=1 Tax=Halalkalibacter akibai (strain ATCC 43226 / DSM 21942 / CIP 109018 / JCM 9157 / 1139) TaxID=1236973 RepID=W4QWC8_HALA3|nr:lasso peptide biosynthesis B2 protein [Halalkalibacter akibai]GAE35943.1 hypothetical protein JCM9157_3085 [Halalkalibacter akibai JCM 9157]